MHGSILAIGETASSSNETREREHALSFDYYLLRTLSHLPPRLCHYMAGSFLYRISIRSPSTVARVGGIVPSIVTYCSRGNRDSLLL